ncbi:MAG: DNA repair protein RecN [Micrococcales bacterium]
MIEEIVIRDLGVISEAKLELGPGFNALTGETGAGKTMVLSALGLLLGERADSATVRRGQSQAVVHGRWGLDTESPLTRQIGARLSESAIDFEPGELIVSRLVSADGKSKASISARPVPASLLTELGEQLVVVHGQSDQIRLKSAVAQREALDNFGGAKIAQALKTYQEAFKSWREVSDKLESLKLARGTKEAEIHQLREDLTEIEKVNPVLGEEERLAALAERLANTEDIRSSLATAHEALSSEEVGESNDVLGLLSIAKRQLEHGANYDPSLTSLATTIQEISYQVRETATQVASQLASLEAEADMSLDEVQFRRSQLTALIRRFGKPIEEILQYQASAGLRLLELDNSGDLIEALEAQVAEKFMQVSSLGGELSKLRSQAARELESEVTEELQALAMPGSSLVVQVSDSELSVSGADQIAILLVSYPGAEPRPLGKGASGGELSRIMLAIEVVLAKNKSNPTFIFDEVDAGVGGAAAIEIGKRLARLAKQAQVIVVTHLAQVAAFADNHLRVLKTSGDQYTASDVVRLTEVARVEELARMLSGLADSELARAHAAELWQLAKGA